MIIHPDDVLIILIWGFHQWGGTPIAGWFVRENAIKMDDLGVPPIYGNHHMVFTYHSISMKFHENSGQYRGYIRHYQTISSGYLRLCELEVMV